MHVQPADAATWLERARQRDAQAAEALVEWLYPVVMGVVHRRLPRGLEPEDVAQEVFLRLFEALEGFRGGPAALEAWVRRVTFRVCLNHWRHQRSRPEWRWSDLSPAELTWLEGRFESGETVGSGGRPDAVDTRPDTQTAARDLVERLLSELSPPDRWLIEKADLEECDLAELQGLTGWSAVNLRVRLFRARRRLRRIWRERVGAYEDA